MQFVAGDLAVDIPADWTSFVSDGRQVFHGPGPTEIILSASSIHHAHGMEEHLAQLWENAQASALHATSDPELEVEKRFQQCSENCEIEVTECATADAITFFGTVCARGGGTVLLMTCEGPNDKKCRNAFQTILASICPL